MAQGQSVTLAASAARTTSADTGLLAGFIGSSLRVQLQSTTVTGTTPTLDVVVEDTLDAGATWNTIGTFTQQAAAARQVININQVYSSNIRVRWTVGGTTPSFTFAVLAYVEQ